MLLNFLIVVLIFMLPFITIISLFPIFDKNRRIRETWKARFKASVNSW